MLAPTRLFQPSGQAFPGLSMRNNAPLCNSLFPTSDALENGQPLLHKLIGLDVQQVRAGKAMLSDENRLLVPLDVREEFGGSSLEGGNKFGAHNVILQYHFHPRQ